jgi:hypothetical protein
MVLTNTLYPTSHPEERVVHCPAQLTGLCSTVENLRPFVYAPLLWRGYNIIYLRGMEGYGV